METELLFSETQKFKQWWLYLILLGLPGIFLYGIFKQVIGGQQFGNSPMSNTALIVTTVITFLLSISFFVFRLDTKIKKDGIYVRFFPIHLSFRYYAWNKISKCYVRQYNAMAEYGGWGFRLGLFGKGRAFNMSGNKGLQLEFSNNKKLLIGTNKPEELTKVLNEWGQLKQ